VDAVTAFLVFFFGLFVAMHLIGAAFLRQP